MIKRTNLLLALNIKANDFCSANSVDAVFAGKSSDGSIYSPDPSTSYIRFDLIGNDIQRMSVKGNETDAMLNGIYQAKVMIGKSSGKNPTIRSAQLSDLLQDTFTQELMLVNGGQKVRIARCNVDIEVSDKTHEGLVVSIYFDCLG